MTVWYAIDTGTTRNATALARVTRRGHMWAATGVWTWQGSQGNPLSIEGTVGPMVRALVERDGVGIIAADNVYAPELRRGMGGNISLKVQGGELKDIYGPMRRGAHE